MATKKSEDRHVMEMLELGRKNAELWPRVQRWCEHLSIEMTSAGLLAEIHKLPIGSLRVACPHGKSLSESMHLHSVARTFILANCDGCPYHKEVSADNYGSQ